MADPEDESEDGQGNSQLQAELLKSYLAFGKRALRRRWKLCATIGVIGIALTAAVTILFPRTYKCTTVLMGMGTPVLDGRDTTNPLASADALIYRHENLEGIIRDTQLVAKFEARRPPLLKAKESIMTALRGEPDARTKVAILVGTLENKLHVTPEKGDQAGQLTIMVEWTDGQTAADIADAARESFVRARRTAEMSAFEDRAAILDAHASSIRDEVQALAEQVMAAARQNLAEAKQTAVAGGGSAAGGSPPAAPRLVRVAPRATDPLVTAELSGLNERLTADKAKVAELENDWQRRLRDEQGKLADLKLKFTDSHPQVVLEQERVAMLSQTPAELASLKAEIKTLEQDVRARGLARSNTAGGAVLAGGSNPAETLPPAIMQALETDDVDPALRAQLSKAVVQYGDIRGDMRMDRIALDTAQAAFNHRYQVMIPADVPSKPDKPKPALIIIAGLVLTLLLGAGLPVLFELRRNVIVERWQVHQLQLPVLAELKLPPHSF
jgi:uncharacterized protein involved in exopolysaccharide biosynthesis